MELRSYNVCWHPLELETKVICRFLNISQSRRRPLLALVSSSSLQSDERASKWTFPSFQHKNTISNLRWKCSAENSVGCEDNCYKSGSSLPRMCKSVERRHVVGARISRCQKLVIMSHLLAIHHPPRYPHSDLDSSLHCPTQAFNQICHLTHILHFFNSKGLLLKCSLLLIPNWNFWLSERN